ncbi:MAG: acyltransferase family protein [Pseudomonadota bacterium]
MTRRHDIDWLRALLFGLLVLHHVAVGFAPFGAEIYGLVNDRLAGDGLSLAIYFSHSWRLPTLFLIAGLGTWFATGRGAGPGMVGRRLARLLVPALFATFSLNVIAALATAYGTGEGEAFWAEASDWWLAPQPFQVMHLWFLYNLALYTLLAWPLFLARNRLGQLVLPPRMLLLTLALAVTSIAVLAKPWGAAIAGDAYQWPWYLGFFLGGYLIGSQHRHVLNWLARRVYWLIAAGVGLFLAEVGMLASALERDLALGAALASGGWAAEGLAPAYGPLGLSFVAVEGLNAWAWSLAAVGLAARYLNRDGPYRDAISRAVFPVYVLHFPVMFVGLAALTTTAWPWGVDFLLLTLWTYGVTIALYALATYTGPFLYLIGGRPARNVPAVRSAAQPSSS